MFPAMSCAAASRYAVKISDGVQEDDNCIVAAAAKKPRPESRPVAERVAIDSPDRRGRRLLWLGAHFAQRLKETGKLFVNFRRLAHN